MDRMLKSTNGVCPSNSIPYNEFVGMKSGTYDRKIVSSSSKIENSTSHKDNKLDDNATASDWGTGKHDRDIHSYPDIIDRETELRETICKGFRNILSNREPDETELDEYVLKIQKKYGFMYLGMAVTQIYIEYYNRPVALRALCSSLIRFDMDEVKPWGQSLILGLINHRDESVKESVVELIDNWSGTFMIDALKTIRIASPWLEQYVADVVSRLENRNVLYKKII